MKPKKIFFIEAVVWQTVKNPENNTKRSQQSNNAIIIVMKPYLYIPIPWYYTVRSLFFSYCDEICPTNIYCTQLNTKQE